MKKLMKKQLNLQEIYEQFQRYNIMRNLSSSTISYYQNKLATFFEFIEDNSPEDINQNDIEEFIFYLKFDKKWSDTSINIHLRAVRAFLYYAMEKQYVARFKITMIKETEKVKEPYSEDELKLLLAKPNMKTCTFAQYRNWVIVNFFIGTGCRTSTLINIKIKDINIVDGIVFFKHTKARTQQAVPLSKSLCLILSEYLEYRKGEPDDILFVTEDGNAFSVGSIEHTIGSYNRSRGVEKTSLHLFRHTFAKLYITAGGDPFRLQKLLGHSDLTMTRKYVALYSDDLRSNYDKINPLEQVTSIGNKIKMKK